ncbi:hypothetical protein HF072_05945 [Bacillus sp. RO3]|nr:hypothetical protein [Bacillus sp. RO3]
MFWIFLIILVVSLPAIIVWERELRNSRPYLLLAPYSLLFFFVSMTLYTGIETYDLIELPYHTLLFIIITFGVLLFGSFVNAIFNGNDEDKELGVAFLRG